MNITRRCLPLLALFATIGILPSVTHAAPKTKAPAARKAPAAKTPARPRPTPTRSRPAPARPRPTATPVWNPQTLPSLPLPTATPVPAPLPTATPVPPVPTPTPVPPRSRTWALLIGISKYSNPQISSLRFPATDAAGIRDALVDPQLGAVPANQIRMLTDEAATAANIYASVDGFLKQNVKAGDQVIVFLAGHGVAKGVGVEAKSYLLPTDARGVSSAALESSAVDLRVLSNKLGELPASQFVLFVDACREDPTPGRGIKGNQLTDVMSRSAVIVPRDDRPVGAVTFFACRVGQRAFEDPRLRHGVFTYWILDGIRQGAVPQRDGTVRMNGLASYVTEKVTQWAQTTSREGDFEVEQTPQAVTESPLAGPIVLMRVKRRVVAEPIAPAPPQITVATFPEGAQVTIDGRPAGAGDVTVPLQRAGSVQIRVEAPGYEPVSRSVQVQDGFAFQVPVQLQPGARAAAPPGNMTSPMFQRALEAEEREQWETAMAGYNMIVQGDPTFQPAYERLASLQRLQGDLPAAINTLIAMVGKTAPSAHGYSLLSRAYSTFWERAVARENSGKKDKKRGVPSRGYIVPGTAEEAAILARRAADEAVRLNANAAEAQMALGFAMIAGDQQGRNRRDALGAFGRAKFTDPKDAATHFGMGYAIRYFAGLDKEGPNRNAEVKRAIESLNEAVALRPEYFEAHRELAYAYYMLDDNEAALRHCEIANACRGNAADRDEVASVNVTMAGIHQEEAQRSQGDKKQQHQAASTGYVSDAKETSKDLAVAMGFLRGAGISTNLAGYLPTELQRAINWKGTIQSEINNKIPGNIPIPGGGGIRLPRF